MKTHFNVLNSLNPRASVGQDSNTTAAMPLPPPGCTGVPPCGHWHAPSFEQMDPGMFPVHSASFLQKSPI